jgi:group I intron endonuclease
MFIYKITNLINNKVYIGQTRTKYPLGRWSAHKNKLNNETHKNPHLLSAWQKYGPEIWSFEIVTTAHSLTELNELEIKYIHQFNSLNPQFGYNIASGGQSHFTLSEEAREKIRKSSKGRKHKPETIEKLRKSNIGREMPGRSPEHIQKQIITKKEWWSKAENYDRMKKIREHQMTAELKERISQTKKAQFQKFGHNQAKSWPSMKSPDNIIYTDIIDMNRFAKERGLDGGKMRLVAHGHRKSHKGWRLA